MDYANRTNNLTGLFKTLLKARRGRVDLVQADELFEVMQEGLDVLLEGMNCLNGALQNVTVFQEAPIAIPEPADNRMPMTLVPSA